MALDPSPTSRKIGVMRREVHDDMQMVRKDHNRIDLERALPASGPKGIAQGVNVLNQNGRSAVEERYSKKVGAAGKKISAIQNHGLDPSRMSLRSSGLQDST